MAFVNKKLLASEINMHGLPFDESAGRYWTRDESRKFYFWGGACGNPAFGDDFQWIFYLCLDENVSPYRVVLTRGEGSARLSDSPYVIHWQGVQSVTPAPDSVESYEFFLTVLKEALEVYGEDGKENKLTPNRVVIFDF